ncbi:glycosyltransferase [Clostridium butyricum]|uniref:Glycosyltransferase n=1 Tax=Clostridium butyricum TaxID=1492 RepID=A0A6L9ETW5_CLOBU|nr:glycosyltransferase [Clostridium butyricum]
MKVVIVNTFYSPEVFGGAEISIQKLSEELIKNDIDVTVITTSNIEKTEIINGVKVIRIKVNNIYDTIKAKNKKGIFKGVYKLIDIYNIFNYKKLKNIIDEIKPDVIHTNNIYGISTIIWRIAKSKKIKLVHTVRDYALICPIVHFSCNNKSNCKYSEICKVYRKNRRNNCKNVDSTVFISNTVDEIFHKLGYFKMSSRNVIYNAIDYDLTKVKKNITHKKENLNEYVNFVYIGTLDYHKGIDLILEVFKKINDSHIRLHIAGKGPLEELVKRSVDSSNNIFFYGFINQENIDAFLLKQDVLIAPSKWSEPFGRVVIDAYKNGLPVIASNIGGFRETVINRRTGLLFKCEDENDLKECIEKLIDMNLRKEILDNLEKELVKYNLENHAQKYLRVYSE